MSVIRKKPEINKIIDDLTDAEKLKLAQEVNNEAPLYTKSLIRKDYYFSELNNNAYEIAGILLEVAPTNTLPGIVIRTNNSNNLREYFIQFAHKQKLIEWRLNTINRTAEVIDEDLDINELRRLVEEVHDHILASEIDSGSATAGQVLSADGEGGTQWANPMDTIHSAGVSEGDVVEIFGFDSEGNLKKDSVPEGIVVDETIVEDSPNAVAGGAVYDALAEKADKSDTYSKDDIDGLLEQKANVDGNYPTMTVGAADNLTPYDEDSGVDQEQPFLLQGTGCGNGEQQVDTGALGLLKEKRGNSAVVNQYAKELNSTNWTATYGSASYNDGVATLTCDGTNPNARLSARYEPLVNGHKYIVIATLKVSKSSSHMMFWLGGGYVEYNSPATADNWMTKIGIAQCTGVDTEFGLYTVDGQENDVFTYKDVALIDLTQWFGSNDNIPAHLLAHPEDFFHYYQGSLAYNEGTLVNSNGRYLKTIGRNQWDEETELGGLNLADGSEVTAPNRFRSKNYIKVIPNQKYYFRCNSGVDYYIAYYDKDKNYISAKYGAMNDVFITPANCCYIRFYTADTDTYANDITISIYYEGESGYDEYYPYEELANIDTGTEVLRSAGSVKDSKAPDGTITRRIGVVDLGSLTWEAATYAGVTMMQAFFTTKSHDNTNINMVCAKYEVSNDIWSAGTLRDKLICNNYNGSLIYVYDSSYSSAVDFKTAMNGVYLFYELAEPTTEQGTSYSENLVIDDFGSMDFQGTNGVPQGALIFYPVDYKAFIDSLYNTLDGDATDIVKESELDSKLATLGYVKLTSVSGYDATKTQVLKNVEGTLTWVTEE